MPAVNEKQRIDLRRVYGTAMRNPVSRSIVNFLLRIESFSVFLPFCSFFSCKEHRTESFTLDNRKTLNGSVKFVQETVSISFQTKGT